MTHNLQAASPAGNRQPRPSTVDAHFHLWHYRPDEFGWIDERMSLLRRDFLFPEMLAEMNTAGIDGAIAVQARQSLAETHWLLETAQNNASILGVVGWAPLADDNLGDVLDDLQQDKKLRALRHVIHDEADDDYILSNEFNRGIGTLAHRGLAYDILVFARHLPQTLQFVDRHPNQTFVLDHIAKPNIGNGVSALNSMKPWATHMSELARRENVWCKVSGVVTEADWQSWSLETLRPYLDLVVQSFGPERLIVGSDWPVCLLASGYRQWFDVLREYFEAFSETETNFIFGGNAVQAYSLSL